MVWPSSRQALTSKKSTSSLLERTRLTASPKEHTGIPSLVDLSSGSLVRFPARTTRLKLTMRVSPFRVDIRRSRALMAPRNALYGSASLSQHPLVFLNSAFPYTALHPHRGTRRRRMHPSSSYPRESTHRSA